MNLQRRMEVRRQSSGRPLRDDLSGAMGIRDIGARTKTPLTSTHLCVS